MAALTRTTRRAAPTIRPMTSRLTPLSRAIARFSPSFTGLSRDVPGFGAVSPRAEACSSVSPEIFCQAKSWSASAVLVGAEDLGVATTAGVAREGEGAGAVALAPFLILVPPPGGVFASTRGVAATVGRVGLGGGAVIRTTGDDGAGDAGVCFVGELLIPWSALGVVGLLIAVESADASYESPDRPVAAGLSRGISSSGG